MRSLRWAWHHPDDARRRRQRCALGILRRVGLIALISTGATLALAVPALAQTATTGPPIGVTTTGALVSITFNPGGPAVGYQVLVGPTGSPLTSAEGHLTGPFSGTTDVNVSVALTNLMPNTSYTYQAEIIEFDNDATTDGNTGTFTTGSVPTGPGTPILPAQNPPANGIFPSCGSDPECVASANGVNASQEGLPPIALPSNWQNLTGAQQLFVATNLERVVRGEAPIPNLVNSYDAAVQAGVQTDSDPSLANLPGLGRSIVAIGQPTPFAGLYGWMYNDGPGGENFDCTTPTSPGCWGHRDALLDNPGGLIGNPTEMDAGAGPDNNGTPAYAAVLVNNPNPTPAANIVFSWDAEQPFLGLPPLGGVVPHGRAPKVSHLVLAKSTFAAAAGHKAPAVILSTQSTAKGGTLVSYEDSQTATTTFTVRQRVSGVITNGKCVAVPRHQRKREKGCVRRLTIIGSFAHADVAGANRFRFMGRLNGRVLKPGNYLVDVTPRNHTGRVGETLAHTFTIVR